DTDMVRAMPAEVLEKVVAKVPMQRLGSPEDVARLVRFLATEGDYITGQQLNVNGGLYCWSSPPPAPPRQSLATAAHNVPPLNAPAEAVTPSHQLASPEPVGVAVVGCGYWGPNLIRNFLTCPASTVVPLCDQNEATLGRAGAIVPAARRTREFQSLL